MRVYILSSENNFPYALRLLSNIENIDIVYDAIESEDVYLSYSLMKRNMELADVVFAIIDDKYKEERLLQFGVDFAMHHNKKKLFIPVIVGKCEVPADLHNVRCYDYDNEFHVKEITNLIRGLIKKTNKKPFLRDYSKHAKIFGLLFALISTLLVLYPFSYEIYNLLYLLDIITGVFFVFSLVLYLLDKNKSRSNNELTIYSKELSEAIKSKKIDNFEKPSDDDSKQSIDALKLMQINLKNIKRFYKWSQDQAVAAFVFAVSLCILGFLLITTAVILPMITELSLELSLIPAVGGVVTELIAGTALIVYRQSILQLNHYHEALHEDERFLSSVALLENLSTIDKQDDMLQEIIRSEIQMNVLTSINGTGKIKSSNDNTKKA